MKRFVAVVVGMLVIILACSGCGKEDVTVDAEGVVHEFFEDIEEVSLEELLYCKVVDEEYLRETDKQWLEGDEEEYYASCLVQTEAIILCEEDSAFGECNEKINEGWVFKLVMKEKNSAWEVADYGYPNIFPYYQGHIVDQILVEYNSDSSEQTIITNPQKMAEVIDNIERVQINDVLTEVSTQWDIRLKVCGVEEDIITVSITDKCMCAEDTWYRMSEVEVNQFQSLIE